MTDASSLTPIAEGAVADSATLRNNFTYLDNRITNLASTVSSVEKITNKNKPNGYCGLDANSRISSSNMPSNYLDSVNSNISSINTQISSINTQMSNINSSKLSVAKSGTSGDIGYVKFSNGLIVQWGKENSGGHSYNHKYTLATSFATKTYKVIANLYNTDNSDRVFYVIKTLEKSYFYARAQGVESGSGGTTACGWIAIGF